MKKLKLFLAAAVLLALAAPAFSSGSKAGGAAPDKGKKLILSVYTTTDAWKAPYDKVASAIEGEYGIGVDVVRLPDEQMNPLINVKLTTNDPPDLFIKNTPQDIPLFNATQTCIPLDTQSWVSRLSSPGVVKFSGDGKIYGMPVQDSASFFGGVYYNKDIMDKIGIKDPAPKTYGEFLDICERVKKTGYTPIWLTSKDLWCVQVWSTMGWAVAMADRAPGIYDEFLTNKKRFTDVPELVTLLQQYRDLITAGYVNEDHMSQPYDAAANAIGEGKGVMIIQGEWFANVMQSMYPNIQMGSFGIPFLDKDLIAGGAYVPAYHVPKAGKNVETALKYIDIWSQPKFQNMIFKETPGFPAFKDVDGGEALPSVRNL
ncbi:MAG: extracellular solute-binding protein [Treponema sp.]|jgi:raffinose/stachyose/melibiose transport system substrate-binding protein|nr:extracellular solute-binding protein [Treponema sp.]